MKRSLPALAHQIRTGHRVGHQSSHGAEGQADQLRVVLRVELAYVEHSV